MELGPHDSVEGLLRLHKSRSDRTDPKPHLVRLSGLGHPGPVQSGTTVYLEAKATAKESNSAIRSWGRQVVEKRHP
jgi:acyl dehydratase